MLTTDGVKPTVPGDFQGTLVPVSAQKRQVLAHDTAISITPAYERYFETLKKIEETKEEIISTTTQLDELTQHIETLNERIKVRQNQIKELESHIEERESHIQERESRIEERENRIEERESRIDERESHISELSEQNLLLLRQRDEQEQLKTALAQRIATLSSQLEEANQLIAEGKAQIELGLSQQAMSEELTVKIALSRAKIEALDASIDQHKENEKRLQASAAAREVLAAQLRGSAAQLREEVAQHRENATQLKASAAQRRQVVAQSRASIADKFKPLLCKYFNQAFYGKDATISGAPADELYSEYLSNREITVGKDSSGKTCVQVNDPAPFIRFSQDHSDITSCNLSAFTFVDTYAQPLVDHLNSRDCPLKSIAFSSRMSQTLQQLFKHAAEMNGSLTIKFVGASAPTTASSSS